MGVPPNCLRDTIPCVGVSCGYGDFDHESATKYHETTTRNRRINQICRVTSEFGGPWVV